MKKLELPLYIALALALSGFIFVEGQENSALREKVPLSPKRAYAMLGNPQLKLQIIDTRPADEDNFEDTHVPGAIPFPDCDDAKIPAAAKDRIFPYVPTIVVSAEGDAATFEKCKAKFGQAQNLAGGLAAWSNALLPEDTGAYAPPKSAAGGGCL